MFSRNSKQKTVQDILGFQDILSNMVMIDKNEFRIALECKKVNLQDKDKEEVEEIINLFKETINQLKRPIQWWRISRVMDIQPYLTELNQKSFEETDLARKKFLPYYKKHLEYEVSEKKIMSSSVYLILGYRFGTDSNGEVNKSFADSMKSLIINTILPKKNIYATMTFEEKIDEVSQIFNGVEKGVRESLKKVRSDVRRLTDDELYSLIYQSMQREMAYVQRWSNISDNGIPMKVSGSDVS